MQLIASKKAMGLRHRRGGAGKVEGRDDECAGVAVLDGLSVGGSQTDSLISDFWRRRSTPVGDSIKIHPPDWKLAQFYSLVESRCPVPCSVPHYMRSLYVPSSLV